MKIIIHRGRNEIGGNCIEIISPQIRILLDIGQPLSDESVLLTPEQKNVDAVIISHPHQDHYGLIDQVPGDVPVYMGLTAQKLIRAIGLFLNRPVSERNYQPIHDLQPFSIGDITLTPYLVDHSAFDAYALLVESGGKRIFYTGDLRMHGRKSYFMERLLRETPEGVDTLITEGTMLDRDHQAFPDETAVENAMVRTLQSTAGICFLAASSQNLDRMVSAYRASLQSNRTLVVDIYTAWVLREISRAPGVKGIPDMQWDRIRVLARGRTAGSQYQTLKENRSYFGQFISEIYSNNIVITESEIAAVPGDYLVKTSYITNLVDRLALRPCSVIYSMWGGYLRAEHNPKGWQRWQTLRIDPEIRFEQIHTSGHAVMDDLRKIVAALNPNEIIPIHTVDGDRLLRQLKNERRRPMTSGKTDIQINAEVAQVRGKSAGWPGCLEYKLLSGTASVVLSNKKFFRDARKVDSWGIAFFDHCRKTAAKPPTRLEVEITGNISPNAFPKAEALKRRLSYLNWSPEMDISFIMNGKSECLYERKELMHRPVQEVVRTDYKERSDDDVPGRLEKDFQAYLFGKGKNDSVRTNERLAILGEDFRDLNKTKDTFVMEREFPTGVFRGNKARDTRILPTEYIDVVSFNKWRELALIELKVNDPGLPVIAQSLDYALFFFAYQKQLWDLLETKLKRRPQKKKFILYVANNTFHSRFDGVAGYYSPSDKDVPFDIRKVVLGYTASI